MIRFAVLGSGRGSNFDAIALAARAGRLAGCELAGVLSDKPDAAILEKGRAAGVPAIGVAAAKGAPREEHDGAMLRELRKLDARFVVMAGYMRIVTPAFLEPFRSERGYFRVVNVHPSLLPAFPGTGGYAQAFRHGAMVSGATVHLVDGGLDSGPICAQEAFAIGDCRSEQEVEARGLEVEHRLYPSALAWVLPEKFEIILGDRNRVRPN